ncbi:hypothetical protein FKM82_025474 [Ascaphus truei]
MQQVPVLATTLQHRRQEQASGYSGTWKVSTLGERPGAVCGRDSNVPGRSYARHWFSANAQDIKGGDPITGGGCVSIPPMLKHRAEAAMRSSTCAIDCQRKLATA